MHTANGRLHFEIQTSRRSPVGIIRTTYWDKEARKYLHTQHGRITGCSLAQLKLLQLAFREEVTPSGDLENLKILNSREYGASAYILDLAKELELPRMLYSRSEPWVDSIMAMVVGRLIHQGSKLNLLNHRDNTCLWDLCNVPEVKDVDLLCYQPMDRLLERQEAIQKKLAKRHFGAGQGPATLLLYDITSTYFEGEYAQSDLVSYGYNRDRKRGTKQVVIGLVCSSEGCPIACEVYAGNTKDDSTVMDKIEKLRTRYSLQDFTFIGDRGMITQQRFEEIRKLDGITTITAMTHGQLKELKEREVIQLELFSEKNIIEVQDPAEPDLRYCLCKNPEQAAESANTRKALIALTAAKLEEIANYKRASTVEKLGARVGKVMGKYKMGKFFDWEIIAACDGKSKTHQLKWSINEEKRSAEAAFDGCYVIRTDVSSTELNTAQVVAAYKSLGNVERAFRNLKTVQLQIRPVCHKKDDRIRAHVFLCMLSYYVQWHMNARLQPLFAADGVGEERRWTFDSVIERLKQITKSTVSIQGVTFEQISTPSEDQQTIIDLLKKHIATDVKF